jgi:hypothetical protein
MILMKLWEPTTTHLQASYQLLVDRQSKQALANQCGPRQRQRPLGQAPLATADKDLDPRHASQSGSQSYSYIRIAHLEHIQQERVS